MGPSDVGLYFWKMYLVTNLSSSVSHRSISSLMQLSPLDRLPARLRHLPVLQGGLPLHHRGGDHAALLLLQLWGPPRRADQVEHCLIDIREMSFPHKHMTWTMNWSVLISGGGDGRWFGMLATRGAGPGPVWPLTPSSYHPSLRWEQFTVKRHGKYIYDPGAAKHWCLKTIYMNNIKKYGKLSLKNF